ncbi:MAG TPA: hypothetical protein VIX63_15905 [Vicinamibacterales bacterium]
MAASRVSMFRMTRGAAIWAGCILVALGALGYAIFVPRDPLRVQVLDVSGYADDVRVWMPFRVNLGLTNTGRDLVTIRRIHVEPDFDGFNEAYNVGTYELEPPLLVEPGSSLTYQAAVTLLNATQLQEGTHPMVLRVRIEQNGEEATYEFPAEFDHAQDPARRAVRY